MDPSHGERQRPISASAHAEPEGDTGIRPGIIGELGADRDFVSPAEERVLRAGGRAHLRTGLAITLLFTGLTMGVTSLTDRLNLRLAYTYLDAEITEDPDGGLAGMTPTTIPRHTIAGWADYTIRDGSMFDGVGAGLGVRYVGSSFGDDANTFKVPSATVVDAVLSYERDKYEVSVNASNLFDKEYVASCGNADYSCFYGEGRRITGKATIRW